MSNRSSHVPSYRLHKPTGLAVVTIQGRDHYLGRHGSPESRAEYDRLVGEWLASQRSPTGNSGNLSEPTIDAMILKVWMHAKGHYRRPDGTPTRELDNLRDALRPLRKLYGSTSAAEFGPLALRAVREEMIRSGLCRTTINARVNRIRRAFRWAVSLEMIPVTVAQALATVPGLQWGRSGARESAGVQPVRWTQVEATLPYLPRQVAAMVNLMRYSNCRAGDAVLMRGCDLDREGEVWIYRPFRHKNEWRGQQRMIRLGQRAQAAIGPFLLNDSEQYLFSPAEATREHHARRALLRTSKRTPSNSRLNRRRKLVRLTGSRYTVNTLQQAVRRGCRRAGVPVWTLLQIRHARATEVRERFGIEGAQASLGHARVETSQIYADRNDRLADRIAREIG